MKKIDFYRIYRILTAIRKSSFFSGLDSIDKLKYNSLLIESLKDLYKLENLANTSLQIFIFLTASFISSLQILFSIQNIDHKRYTIIFVISYSVFVIILQITNWLKRRKLNKEILFKQISHSNLLELKEKEIRKAEIQDDLFGKLTELKLLDELSLEIFEDNSKNEEDKKREIDTIIESAGLITKEIEKKRKKLHDID